MSGVRRHRKFIQVINMLRPGRAVVSVTTAAFVRGDGRAGTPGHCCTAPRAVSAAAAARSGVLGAPIAHISARGCRRDSERQGAFCRPYRRSLMNASTRDPSGRICRVTDTRPMSSINPTRRRRRPAPACDRTPTDRACPTVSAALFYGWSAAVKQLAVAFRSP